MWVKLFFLTIGLFFSKDGLNKIDNSDFSDISDSSDPEHGFIPSSDPLNVHLLVTSHMDAGWVHTFEEYYKGVQGYSGECVKCILDNVMKSFSINPERKYDMAEVAFFNKWWADQTPENRAAFKEFAKKNQFRFVNGGWVTNDEATAYYDDIMENFILGHRWLKDNLDMDSNVGWQVDSFGNSAAHAGLMAQAGYDAMFFSRADYRDRDKRKLEKSLQFNWAPPNPHNESIFTQMLYLGYSDSRFVIPESEKCRTIFCKGNLTKSDYTKVEDLVKKQAESFNTKNILLLVCDDFLFSDESEKYYKGAEAMIKHFDKHPSRGIKVKYSHLSEYVNQVIQDISSLKPPVEMPIKHDDTYPYIEQRNHIWTGYFTSKSMYKMLVREFSAYYNAAKLLLTKILLLNNKDILDWDNDHSKVNDALNLLEQPLALIQHHDSITGTMKDFVRRDYEDIVLKARTAFEEILQPIMVKYLHNKTDETFTSTNISYNWLYQDDSYYKLFNNDTIPAFTVFNPGNTRSLLIKLKVPTPSYNILNESNILIPIDVICHNQDSNDDCFIYFVDNFIAYSTKAYKVVPIASGEINNLEATDIPNKDTNLYTSDSLSVNVSRNLLDFEYQYCLDQKSCTKDTFTMDYYYYDTSAKNKGVPSGAYLFGANNMEKVPYSAVNSGRIFKGKYLTVLQIFRDDLRTDIKILHHQPERGFEVDTYLLPPKEKGREIVLVVKSDSINNGDSNHTIFYTDSNGYSMQKRTKNHKDGFDIDTTDAISINFYPMTSNMYIESEKTKQRLSIVTDRAQGVASLNTGELEVMIHRVTFRDDNKGVGEALQEKVPNTRELINVTTRHFISYSQASLNVNDQRRQQQYDLDRSPYLWFYISKTPKFEGNFNNEGKELVLPELVKLYVRSYQPDEYIVRLHNLDDNNAKNVELYDVKTNECTLLTQFAEIKGFEVESVKELSWMTTKDKSDLKKNILDPESLDPRFEHNPQYNNVNLVPMEIRTFSIKRKLNLFQNVPDATVE